MGQDLLNPPSVEGWHTGTEWINSGSLMRRVNFTADYVGDIQRPGIRSIISRLKDQGELTPEMFVDTCLDLMGPLEVNEDTRRELVSHAGESGVLSWEMEQDDATSSKRVGEMLQLIVSLRGLPIRIGIREAGRSLLPIDRLRDSTRQAVAPQRKRESNVSVGSKQPTMSA